MATSMLGSAVKKAAAAASEEMSLLMGVQEEIRFMKGELETMQAFLGTPEVTKKNDKLVKVWAQQVRKLSYDIEACLDEFTVHVGSQRLSQQMMKLKDRHRIAVQIRNLKARVEEVSSRKTRYNLIKAEASSTMDEEESNLEYIRNHTAIDEAQLVGFDEPKKKLLEMIQVSVDDGQARVISVVGMGGLGKTTLARKIYESKDIAKNFSCCAWITVSQSYSMREILQNMIRQLFRKESLEECHLKERLKNERYFVVLDDLWTTEAWNGIHGIAFPSTNNKGSRIIVTTRDAAIAAECASEESLIYHLEPLQIDDAIELLLSKARNRAHKDMDEKLKKTVTQLAEKCGCLPLAILTVGGILASKEVKEWGKYCKQLHSEVESNQSLKPVRRIVTLSYNHLPSHLKPCFLYLSIFPEDFEIERRRLVERWVAEGLVTVEEVGESYFRELISRSMIQPARVNIEGVVKSCRVHDIVRDTIVSISREENFVYSTQDDVPVVGEKFCHVAYHRKSSTNVGMDWSCVWSLTCFGERPMKSAPSLCSSELRMLRALDLKDAQFKVTQQDIDNIGLLQHLKYVNAQYDCNKRYYDPSNIHEVPRSIGKLQSLQALDLRGHCISALPAEVTKLQSLYSLRCSRHRGPTRFDRRCPLLDYCLANIPCLPTMFTPQDRIEMTDTPGVAGPRGMFTPRDRIEMPNTAYDSKIPGVAVPRGMGNLKALQILEFVNLKGTSMEAIEELGELSQLRKLRVTTRGATKEKCDTFRKALEKLTSLRSVYVDGHCDNLGSAATLGTIQWLDSSLWPPPLLRSLKLIGELRTAPDWFGDLSQLVKIYLELTYLKDLEILGALPNLMLLRLMYYAYSGKKLTFRTGAFQSLKKLDLSNLQDLSKVRFEEDASPLMESIDIEFTRIKSGIFGIKHLLKLKEISLDCWVRGLDMLQGEVDQHPTHPVLRVSDSGGGDDDDDGDGDDDDDGDDGDDDDDDGDDDGGGDGDDDDDDESSYSQTSA